MASTTPIIGSIIERKPTSSAKPSAPKIASGSGSTGFPTVQHRSKSAFTRNREEAQRRNAKAARLQAPPPLASSNLSSNSRADVQPLPSKITVPTYSAPLRDDPLELRDQISNENDVVIAGMSPEEIEEERRQIIERFGLGISDVLERARRNRMKRASETDFVGTTQPRQSPPTNMQEAQPESFHQLSEVPISPEERKPSERARSPPPPALSAASTRPSSRADRRLRFAELDPKDVYVYESSPPSPRKPVLALPPPSDDPDPDVISLGQWHGRMAPNQQSHAPLPSIQGTKPEKSIEQSIRDSDKEPEEGTPEYIRRHYFPDIPADDPSIEWMKANSNSSREDSSIRFDLYGAPIPSDLGSTLPTHLGLHHHAEGSRAGYTLEDIFLLSRSTVPAQRATMFGVLAGISERLSKLARGQAVEGLDQLKGEEERLRKRIVAAGVEAMNKKGNVGVQAIDVVWRSIADWDMDLIPVGLDGIYLESPTDEAIPSLALDFFLPSIASIFKLDRDAYPPETFKQLLEITQRLALQNADTATKIVGEDHLLSSIVQHFVLAPNPFSNEEGLLPDPAAIVLLTSLVRASRYAAELISRTLADGLLRFITSLPTSTTLPSSISIALTASTLDFYAALAVYGLYTNVASTAMEQFTNLSRFIMSTLPDSTPLIAPWLKLTQIWTTCAIDPHATTPPHDITWSRVTAWAWHSDALFLSERLGTEDIYQWKIWGDLFDTLAAWLEGSKVNGLRGGETERNDLLQQVRTSFATEGKLFGLLQRVIEYLQGGLSKPSMLPDSSASLRTIVGVMHTLSSVIRLWLACLPSHLDGAPEAPPFNLPYGLMSSLAAAILSHPVWNVASSPLSGDRQSREKHYDVIYLRELASFLACYLRLSRKLPDTSPQLWLAQALSISLRYMPGGEDVTLNTIDQVLRLVPDTASTPGVLEPFLEDAVLPRPKVDGKTTEETEVTKPTPRLTPLIPTPQSITYSTTSIIPSPFTKQKLSGLPLHSNWMLTPLHHLLHSGESFVLKHLPKGWDFSELDVSRSSLALALKTRQALLEWKLPHFALKKEEAVLACMEIIMLEHGLMEDKERTSANEVFRDPVVESLMGKLVDPYRFGSTISQAPVPVSEMDVNLESFAATFLGPSTPFYQFFTDLVALYDAISFSHPLFGQLLLPPISMRYAIDYRRLLWCDYPHILRTIRVYPNQVLSVDLREYLYPVETIPQVIGAYLSALLKGNAKEFLRWVALHHVASNIWRDLRDEKEDGSFSRDRATKLLQAIVGQGDTQTVSDVVKYTQPPRTEGFRTPPDCFDVSVISERKAWIESSLGEVLRKKLTGLL